MAMTSRRERTPDPLVSTTAVREVLAELAARLPHAPRGEKALVSFLRAAVYAERTRSASRRGRPSKWPERDLVLATSILRDILGRGAYGRKNVRSFVDHYLRILAFPAEVREALEGGEVNLFEAEQLARLTPKALGVAASTAAARRRQVIKAHLAARESGARLRARVDAVLARSDHDASDAASALPFSREVLDASAELETEFAGGAESLEADPTSVFYDLLSTIALTLREIDPSDVPEEDQERLFEYGDKILMILGRVRRRRDRSQR